MKTVPSGKKEDVFFVLFLLLSITLSFYGCDAKNDRGNFSKKSEKNEIFEEKTSSQSSQTSLSEPDDNIASILGQATDSFEKTFQDSTASKSDEDSELKIDPEIQNKFLKERRLTLLPEVETASSDPSKNNIKKYHLKYKFHPGQELRWEVTHEVRKNLTYAGKTQAISTYSRTWRRWNLLSGGEKPGQYICEHTIDAIDLRQQEEGKEAVTYRSREDEVVPREFAIFGTDKTVGKVLERFTIDSQGMMTQKEKLVREYHGLEKDSKVLVPFPEVPIGVGASWTVPMLLFLKGRDGTVRSYQATEKFTLESVQDRLASIRFRTILLSIVTDPVIEAQLAEKMFTGRARFDLEQGITLQTELDFTKSVANALGDASHLDYRCHVVEKLLREEYSQKEKETR